jgi:hypothetical protein
MTDWTKSNLNLAAPSGATVGESWEVATRKNGSKPDAMRRNQKGEIALQ